MKFEDALKIQNSRVCSDCYGPVIVVLNRETKEHEIKCSTPGCGCRGTISRHTLERRQAENAAEAHDAREALKKAALDQSARGQERRSVTQRAWILGENQMPITTVKSSMSFPEAGQIRKGAPKEKREKNGRAYETVGKDLGQAVRFVVFEGRDSAFITAKLLDLYGLTSTKPILCMLPFAHVADCWEVYNECYTGGRMVARADGERYIRYVNPATGAVEVDEGEPYRPYNGERSIEYDNKEGKHFVLPIKPVGKLKVFLPELERFVWFTVKTTSYYDAINLEAQLSAIQGLADTLNNGSCAGIRFYLYRMQKDVTWNKPDGTASRVPKWLLNVEVDPEWVKAAVARLSQFALTGQGTAAGLLPATIGTISGTTDPNDDYDHEEGEEGEPDEHPDPEPVGEFEQTPIIIDGDATTITLPEFKDDELAWALGVIYTLPSTKGYQGKALAQIEKYDPGAIDFLAGEKFLPSTEEGIIFKRAAMIIQKGRK